MTKDAAAAKLFSSAQVMGVLESTPSVKTRLAMCMVLAPR
jgi:hypothetical protein